MTHRCGKCHQETQHGLQGLTACFHEGVALKSLPPEECGIGKGNVYPVLDILREPIEHNVTVGKQHVLSPLTSVIMPPGRRIPEIVTVVFPFQSPWMILLTGLRATSVDLMGLDVPA